MSKKQNTVEIQHFIDPQALLRDEATQSMMEHLLISLGNVYETYKDSDQVRVMVLKVLMIVAAIFSKIYSTSPETLQKNLTKIRKINNSLIHKDCLKFVSLLAKSPVTIVSES